MLSTPVSIRIRPPPSFQLRTSRVVAVNFVLLWCIRCKLPAPEKTKKSIHKEHLNAGIYCKRFIEKPLIREILHLAGAKTQLSLPPYMHSDPYLLVWPMYYVHGRKLVRYGNR